MPLLTWTTETERTGRVDLDLVGKHIDRSISDVFRDVKYVHCTAYSGGNKWSTSMATTRNCGYRIIRSCANDCILMTACRQQLSLSCTSTRTGHDCFALLYRLLEKVVRLRHLHRRKPACSLLPQVEKCAVSVPISRTSQHHCNMIRWSREKKGR